MLIDPSGLIFQLMRKKVVILDQMWLFLFKSGYCLLGIAAVEFQGDVLGQVLACIVDKLLTDATCVHLDVSQLLLNKCNSFH